MKVLRAIGGFFAKIGRWIANTAWIQPLLIVGGIFGIIFSIPYIKQAIDNSKIDNTDYTYEWYRDSSRALDTSEGGRATKLFEYLNNNQYQNINTEFGKKFFVSFIRKDCSNCQADIAGFQELYNNRPNGYDVKDFVLYTIVVDQTDANGDYPAKEFFKNNENFIGVINSLNKLFGEGSEGDYILSKNIPDQFNTIKSNLSTINTIDYDTDDASGFLTPFTFMYDYEKYDKEPIGLYSTGVTAVFFDYTALMSNTDYTDTTTNVAKAQFLSDCWNYEKVFSPNYKD